MFPDLTRDDVFRLETRRLWLRWLRQADTQAIVRLAGEKAVAEMTALIPHPYPPDAATAFVFDSRKANALGDELRLAITVKGRPNHLIGMVGIRRLEDAPPDLGYWLGTPFWGAGYATEAAREALRVAFETLELREVVSYTALTNQRSMAVMRRLGMREAGAFDHPLVAEGHRLRPHRLFRLAHV
jgi:RimJ/RimL family protein N-acetyltransferase